MWINEDFATNFWKSNLLFTNSYFLIPFFNFYAFLNVCGSQKLMTKYKETEKTKLT